MSKWKETIISEIITLIGGGTPKTSVTEYWDGYIPWLSVVDFNNGKKYVFDTEKKITEEGLENSSTKLLDKGDIIISARGTVGVVAMLGKQMAFNQSCYGVRANHNSVNEYVYYLLKDRVSNFLQYSHGGVFDTITRDTFKEIDILLPPLEEQKAIAEVLASLDDKIDLLHRQNQTLEQIAETLFRQWLVEEAGERCEEKPLSEYFQLLGGFAFKSKDYLDSGKYKVITIKAVQDGYLDSNSAARLDILPEKIKPHQILNTGDILMSLTGNVGRVCLVDEENCLLNQRVAKIEPINRKWKAFTYFYFRQNEMIERLTYLSKGSAQLNLSPVETLAQSDHFTDNSTIDSYCEVVNPFLSKIMTNKTQIRTLTALRDTLLPKLMSGEVKVAD